MRERADNADAPQRRRQRPGVSLAVQRIGNFPLSGAIGRFECGQKCVSRNVEKGGKLLRCRRRHGDAARDGFSISAHAEGAVMDGLVIDLEGCATRGREHVRRKLRRADVLANEAPALPIDHDGTERRQTESSRPLPSAVTWPCP